MKKKQLIIAGLFISSVTLLAACKKNAANAADISTNPIEITDTDEKEDESFLNDDSWSHSTIPDIVKKEKPNIKRNIADKNDNDTKDIELIDYYGCPASNRIKKLNMLKKIKALS